MLAYADVCSGCLDGVFAILLRMLRFMGARFSC
jgi:hypothetical protein